jgi:hypothetical protein
MDLPQDPFEAAVDCGVLLGGELLDGEASCVGALRIPRVLISANTHSDVQWVT